MSDLNKLAEALETVADSAIYHEEKQPIREAAALLRAAAGADVQPILELAAEAIYNQWATQDGFVAWVPGGNSHKQTDARRIARTALESAIRLALPVWRPIEEAPKDGTRVLLAVEWSDVPAIGSFSHGSWSTDYEHCEVSCGAFCYGGSVTSEKGFKPTHYMPLPPQPKGQP